MRLLFTVYPRLFQFGALAIPTAGVCTALAILAALLVARITARRLALEPEKVWDLGITGVLTALMTSRLLLILINWKDFVAHPLWMLGLLTVRSQTAVLGGVVGAVAVMLFYAYSARLPVRRTLDSLSPGLAVAYAIMSLGDFLAGSNFGTPSPKPWSIVYTRRLASLWYGTPLGVPLHPVQIYQLFLELFAFGLLLIMVARRASWKLRDGEVFGLWLFLHGSGTFLLGHLRGVAPSSLTTPLPPSILAGCAVLVGGLLWLV